MNIVICNKDKKVERVISNVLPAIQIMDNKIHYHMRRFAINEEDVECGIGIPFGTFCKDWDNGIVDLEGKVVLFLDDIFNMDLED